MRIRRHTLAPLIHESSRLLAIALTLALCTTYVTAFAAAGQYAPKTQYEISSIEFEGNRTIGSGELLARMETKETPGFFDRFLYNTISERLGRKNEYFKLPLFEEDIRRVRQYYKDKGFLDVVIDTLLRFSDEDFTVDITFKIQEGYRSLIDTLVYRGITGVPEFVYEDMTSGEQIRQGDPFDRLQLEEEVARVRLILWNAGYANAEYVVDSSAATYRTSTRNISIVLTYRLGKRYLFGPITVRNELDSVRTDITDDVVLNQVDYKPGDIYSELARKASERNLNRVGVFDQATVQVLIPHEPDTSISVRSIVTVRPKDKHELAPELGLSDENNAFNIGIGLGYTNRNFLGGARTFTTRTRFRTQTFSEFPNYFGVATNAVASAELTFELLQPYIFSNKIRGTWSFSLIRDKQILWRQDVIRNRFGITDRVAEFTTAFFDWTLERVNLTKNPNVVGDPNDVKFQQQLSQLNELARTVQFNSILTATLQRDKSNDLFSPSGGFIHTGTVEESGVFPLLLKKAQPDLPFTQFYRVSLVGRWYMDPSDNRFSILAFKLKGGFEEKYGESRSDSTRAIPTLHRFYGGGAGSVRGWESHRLGATGDPLFGGNLALEGSVELRTNVFKSMKDDLLDRMWIVTFLDFGNVWGEATDFRFDDVAIAAGLGFRYDMFFGPFRMDYGFRVYDPTAPRGKQWITQKRFFGETLPGIFHFGIGQAF
jgi:outer membrane protein insertion porin family